MNLDELLDEFAQVEIKKNTGKRTTSDVWECWLIRSKYSDDDPDGYGFGRTAQEAVATAMRAAKRK